MSEYKYEVYVDRELAASDMPDEIALILIKGLIEEYRDEPDTQISILRMREAVGDDDEE